MRTFLYGILIASFVVGCTESGDLISDQDTTTSAVETEADDTSSLSSDETEMKPSDSVRATPAIFRIGDPAPKFTNLIGVDDKKHSLEDYADAKAIAVVFTCNTCPVAVAYEDRLIEVQNDYADKGVKVVAINVNNAEPDRLPAMKDRATEKGFEFAYLYDPTQQVARDYGAEVTPHVFLLDGSRRLAFVGPVDDNPDGANVSKKYLRDAIDGVLAGKAPETTEVKPVGCGIKYE